MGYQDDKVMERGEERECSYGVPVVVSICPDLEMAADFIPSPLF